MGSRLLDQDSSKFRKLDILSRGCHLSHLILVAITPVSFLFDPRSSSVFSDHFFRLSGANPRKSSAENDLSSDKFLICS